MANVGSVELELKLNRSGFDRELAELQSLKLEPLKLGIELDGKNLRSQIRDLTKDLDCIPVDICAHINVNALKADIAKATADLQADFQVNVRAAVESIVKIDAKKQGETAATNKAQEKLEAGFDKVADTLAAKINHAIDSSLKAVISTAAAPFQGVARGFFEGLGQTASRELSNGIIKNFQKSLDISFKSAGGQFGDFAAKEVGKALGLKPIPKPRTKQQDSDEEGTGGLRRKPTAPKPSTLSAESGIERQLKSVAKDLGVFANTLQKASGGSDKFGASTIKAAQSALELAAGLSKAGASVVSGIQSTIKPAVTQSGNQPVVSEAILKPGRGFLKGDVASLKPEDARKQVEVVRSRLEKQLAALASAPETEATQKKIVSLVNAIATLESRIAADIANPDVPRAVKSSLGQLKGASSKLAETKRTAEAEAARITSNRKLPGIAKGVLGAGIGASALGAGSAFAAPGAGVGGLSLLGALPFDPTLGLAAGGIAGSLFAARQVPKLLRKSGADRAASVLETDVTKLVGDTVKQVFGQVQQGLARAFRKNKTAAVSPMLNSPPIAATDTPATKAFAQNMQRLALQRTVLEEKPQPEDTPATKAFAQNMRRLAASRGGRLPTKPATLPPLPPPPTPQVPPVKNTGRLPTKPATQGPLPLKTNIPRDSNSNSNKNSSNFRIEAGSNPNPQNKQSKNIADQTRIADTGIDKVQKDFSVSFSEKVRKGFEETIANAQQSVNSIFKTLPGKKKKYKNQGLTTSPIGKKVDEIESQIENIISAVQQDILKNQGVYFSNSFVKDLLESGKYYDPRYASAKKQQQFLQNQNKRSYEEAVEDKPRTSVNQLTGKRKLIADEDPIFKQLREVQSKIDSAARTAQQEIYKESGQIYRLRTVKDLLRSGARNDGNYAGLATEKENLVGQLRRKERQAIAPQSAPSPPDKFWENFFRGLETRFFRSPLFSGKVSPKDRRSLTSEAAGFFASAAALAAPGATLTALSVPLLAALTPLITTVGLVTNALAPLVSTVSQTLQRIEPLNARLQYVSGSPQGVQENRNFVQGVAEQFNVSSFSSLEQFSKLSAAVKGTRLEGEPLKELFKGIATAAKGLSLDTQDLSLVMFAFTQIASKGKLSAEEVRLQLAERFPGIVNILAKSLNVTTAEFNKMLETGSLIAEDVLPKLGKALQQEYGAAAVAASGNFLSSLTKVENAIFKIQESVARSLAPLFGFVANTLGNALGLIGQFADKIVPIFSVVLVGVAAQFFVGLTQILIGGQFITKLTAVLIPAYSRLFAALTPFFVGVLADFLDDVVGAQTSVMDNLVKGSYNAVVTLILAARDAKDTVIGLVSNLPKLPQNNSFSGLSDIFSKLGNVLKTVGGIVRGTGVEFVSLTLILAQTLVLAQGGLNLVLARFGTTVAELGTSFLTAAKNGSVFKSSLNTLTAGLNPLQLGITAATAALVLFFAKADFTDELGSSFDKLSNTVNASLDRIRESLKESSKDLEEFQKKLPDFKSKGFDLTVGLGEAFGKEAFRSDDLIKLIRDFKGKQSPLTSSALETLIQSLGGPVGKLTGLGFKAIDKNTSTQAEKFFKDNLRRANEDASTAIKTLDESGLLNGSFANNAAGKALAQIQQIDEKIKGLQGRRIDLLSGIDASSDKVKNQIAEIDKQINAEIKIREPLKAPIESIKTSVIQNSDELKEKIESINKSSFPEAAKKQLINALQPAIEKTEEAKRKLEDLKLIDLSPLGNSFTDITRQIEKTDKALEKALSTANIATTKAQTKIQSDLAAGKITPDVAAREQADEDLRALKGRSRSLETFVKKRRSELRGLLSIPTPTPDQLQAIEKNQKEIESKELELAQNRLAIAQKVVEGRKQIEERLLRDFQKANAKAAEVIGRAENERTTRIKQRQLQGLITPEQAETELSNSSTITAKSNFMEATRQLSEFNKLKKTGRISDEEARQREMELSAAIGDANLRRVEAEISQQQQLRNTEIRAIEDRAQKQKNLADLAVSGIDGQRAAQDLLNSSIDRTKELEQSRFDLSKALSDAAIAGDERRIESVSRALELSKRLEEGDLDSKVRSQIKSQLVESGFGTKALEILQTRGRIEDEIAAKRLAALQQEQDFQKRLLELDLQRQRITAQTAQFEAQIAVLRAQQGQVDAQSALSKAKVSGDKLAIESANIGITIANRQLDLSQQQLENAKENLEIQSELAQNALAAQKATQQSALDQAMAADAAQRQSTALELVEARIGKKPAAEPERAIAPSEPTPDIPAKKGKLSFLEQARVNLSNALGTTTRRYLQPDQSGSIGLDPGTSTEGMLKRSLGINPLESTEQYLSRPRSISFGADSASSFEQLNMKYKPGAANFEELQQKYKPLAESFEELNQKYPNTTPGFTQFTDGIKDAGKAIEQKLDILNQTMAQAIAAPRQLYVSAPNPVSSAAEIYSDIARGMTLNAGLA